jgi:hypothetical protein
LGQPLVALVVQIGLLLLQRGDLALAVARRGECVGQAGLRDLMSPCYQNATIP